MHGSVVGAITATIWSAVRHPLKRVDAHLADGHGGFFERFADSRMGKTSPSDIFGAAAVFHVSASSGNHFGRTFGYHLHA